jgi:AraC-like DNA-binding protein
MIKVVFQPGALFRLLNIPLAEFGGVYVDAASVLNKEMRSINEQLANAENYASMIQIVEDYLLRKVRNIKMASQPIDMIGDILNNQPDQFSLQWFASQACLSPRQFERKFIERIGISPKLYCRITRFHKAFEMKDKNPGLDWLSVAIACGYADFQHLNKDFKQFAGVTPSILLKDQGQVTEKALNLV